MKTLRVLVIVLLTSFALAQKKPLRATTTIPGSVGLSWVQSVSAGVTGNNVYRAPGVCSSSSVFSLINTSATPIVAYTDTAVTATQSYCYQVTATCSTCSPQESVPSNQVSVTVPAGPQPAPPTNLAAPTVTASSVSLQWNAPVNSPEAVKAYRLYRHNSLAMPFNQVKAGITGTTYTDTKALPGTRYYYVASVGVDGVLSVPSNILKVQVP